MGGACYSQPAEEVILDEQDAAILNAPANTYPAGYQLEPVIERNMDTGYANDEVVTSASNANPAVPAQTVATEVVYQDGQQPRPVVSNEVLYQDSGVRQSMQSWGSVPEIPVYSAVNGAALEPEAVEVGIDEFNFEQERRTSMATIGRASVTDINTGHQDMGIMQDNIGDVTEAIRQNPMDNQGVEVYDPNIGGMVHLLNNNQSFDDLESVTTANIRESVGNLDAGTAVATVVGRDSVFKNMKHGLIESDTFDYITTGTESKDGATNISNPNFRSAMNVLSKNEMPTSDNLLDGTDIMTTAADMSASGPVGMKVYDGTIGEMVQVLDGNALVDEMYVLSANETPITGNMNGIEVVRGSGDLDATEPSSRVYDHSIGEMVQVLDHRAPVDGMELIDVNTRT